VSEGIAGQATMAVMATTDRKSMQSPSGQRELGRIKLSDKQLNLRRSGTPFAKYCANGFRPELALTPINSVAVTLHCK
jgi:hypothetical protein